MLVALPLSPMSDLQVIVVTCVVCAVPMPLFPVLLPSPDGRAGPDVGSRHLGRRHEKCCV